MSLDVFSTREDGATHCPSEDVMQFPVDGPEHPPEALVRAYASVCAMLDNLRRSRESLRNVASERLRHTSEKLREVSTATETAAIDILDRLDRALGLVDQLDALDTTGAPEGPATRNALRDELFMAQGGLQFQDITAQQLGHATSTIEQLEQRLASLAELLEPRALTAQHDAPVEELTNCRQQAFASNATMANPEVRQALADSIFEAPAA
jgi:chemotaxis regulatin CheY-phosphate phosphatase CheZ